MLSRNQWLKVRSQTGDFLVEAIVAVLVSGIIAMAMGQMYSQMKRVGNMSQAQFLAASIANGIIDHLRGLPYQLVDDNRGTHTPLLNAPNPTDVLFPRALLIDSSPFIGSGNTSTALNHASFASNVSNVSNFTLHTCNADGSPIAGGESVNVSIERLNGSTDVLQVVINMSFRDTSGRPRSFRMTSMLTRRGITG